MEETLMLLSCTIVETDCRVVQTTPAMLEISQCSSYGTMTVLRTKR